MLVEEKQLFDKRMREEENEFYRKRKLRDQIDENKRQFIQMKLESQRIIENQQRQNYQNQQIERVQKINGINDKVSSLEIIS